MLLSKKTIMSLCHKNQVFCLVYVIINNLNVKNKDELEQKLIINLIFRFNINYV